MIAQPMIFSRYICPVTECRHHDPSDGFATLKDKKHHVKTKHPKKAK